jgi:hypothetical protein
MQWDMMATLHTDQLVKSGRIVAGTRIIPLAITDETIQAAEAHCMPDDPVVSIRPFMPHLVGLITTGSEVYHKRIEDKFGPVIKKNAGIRNVDLGNSAIF